MTIPIVQDYDVRSEGPILPWLQLIVPDGKISHYYTGSLDGVASLELLWHETVAGSVLLGSRKEERGGRSMWRGPSVLTVAASIEAWLEAVEYPARPNVDGSLHKGWRLTNHRCGGYCEFVVFPHWQVYGK